MALRLMVGGFSASFHKKRKDMRILYLTLIKLHSPFILMGIKERMSRQQIAMVTGKGGRRH